MLVLDRLFADADEAGTGIHLAARVEATALECRCNNQRLEGGTRLDDVGDGAIAEQRGLDLAAVVRVVARLVDVSEDFTGGDIDDDRRSRRGLVLLNGRLERPIGKVLDAQIDRSHQVAARTRRLDALDILDHPAQPVAQHALLARHTLQPVVERQLQAFLAAVIDIGEAEQMTGHFAGRIVATIFRSRCTPGICRASTAAASAGFMWRFR